MKKTRIHPLANAIVNELLRQGVCPEPKLAEKIVSRVITQYETRTTRLSQAHTTCLGTRLKNARMAA